VTDITTRDALSISIVAGSMVGTMASFISIFATGLDDPDIMLSLRSGIVAGFSTASLLLIFALYRIREISSKGDSREERRNTETEYLRSILSPVEEQAQERGITWSVKNMIRRDRGVLLVEIAELDPFLSSSLVERLIQGREGLRKVKIRTGFSEASSTSKSDPGSRPAILQRLKIDSERVNWQVIQKSSSITLRPMGEAPSPRLWAIRFGIFVIPVTLVMSLAFRDLAGNGLEQQGIIFGSACGIIISALAASFRDRTS
jgi:hypothetical protein